MAHGLTYENTAFGANPVNRILYQVTLDSGIVVTREGSYGDENPAVMQRRTIMSGSGDILAYPPILTIPAGTPIPGQPVSLRHDITANLEFTEEGVVMSAPFFDEEGFGETYEAAKTDLLTSLHDRRLSMKKREIRLSAHDREILFRLERAIA